MANPQKENGYTSIANELMEALARIRISGEARQVLDLIFRKTYGYHKTQDAISLSQFCNGTGLKKSAVIKGLHKLKDLNLITQKDNAVANIYRFNKDFDTWKPLPKKITEPKKEIKITQKVNFHNPKRDIQKIVSKETITKDNALTFKKVKNHSLWGKIQEKYPDRDYEFYFQEMCDWYKGKKKKLPVNISAFTNWLSRTKPDPYLQDRRLKEIQRQQTQEMIEKAKQTPQARPETLEELKKTAYKAIGKAIP